MTGSARGAVVNLTSVETERFLLRELTEQDVSERYLAWFKDPETRSYVSVAASMRDMSALKRYVRQRMRRADVLFWGIFDKRSRTHIGNLKYEPIDAARGYAVMGILIGEESYRGKGVAHEVLAASGEWLRNHRSVRQIILGVNRSNTAAIRAYEKVGFRVAVSPYVPVDATSVTMVWEL